MRRHLLPPTVLTEGTLGKRLVRMKHDLIIMPSFDAYSVEKLRINNTYKALKYAEKDIR